MAQKTNIHTPAQDWCSRWEQKEESEAHEEALIVADTFSPAAEVIVYEGDCLRFLDDVPSAFFKLIVTSPPYNIGKEYESAGVRLDDYLAWQAEVIRKLVRVLADDGSICWEVGSYVSDGEIVPLDILFYDLFKKHSLRLRNRIIWHYEHGLHATKRLSGRYETILWFTKSNNYTFNLDPIRVPSKYPGKRHYKGPNVGKLSGNPKGKNPSDVWKIVTDDWDKGVWDIPNVKANHPEKTEHPCQFPVELVERCVLALSNEGDWVLDPFGGVGSSVIAAVKNNRRAAMSEKESDYADTAKKRLEKYMSGDLKMRDLGKPIHKPSGRLAEVPDEWQTTIEQTPTPR